jgi:hypothetical protein
MLTFNFLYVFLAIGISYYAAINLVLPDKASILRFAVLYTIGYAIVIALSMKLKDKWRRNPASGRPENLLVAGYSYLVTLPINIAISLYLRDGAFTYAPFLFAINQGILGYFVASYIDRSLRSAGVSWRLAVFQGIAQAVGIVIATQLSPSLAAGQAVVVGIFSVFQSATSGFLVGIFFQRLFKSQRAENLSEAPELSRHLPNRGARRTSLARAGTHNQ